MYFTIFHCVLLSLHVEVLKLLLFFFKYSTNPSFPQSLSSLQSFHISYLALFQVNDSLDSLYILEISPFSKYFLLSCRSLFSLCCFLFYAHIFSSKKVILIFLSLVNFCELWHLRYEIMTKAVDPIAEHWLFCSSHLTSVSLFFHLFIFMMIHYDCLWEITFILLHVFSNCY